MRRLTSALAFGAALLGAVAAPGSLSGQSQTITTQRTAPPRSAVAQQAPLTQADQIAVRSLVRPPRVYVGQQATYEVGVFLSEEAASKLRRNPEFVPPELRSILAYDLAGPPGTESRMVNGVRFDVHVFQRALFPLTAGHLDVPPARLTYALPLTSSFFSREESHTLRTERAVLEALDPPAAGRPASYRGAVGRLSVDAHAAFPRPRVGDPFVLTVAVSGVGNVALFPRPDVALPWGEVIAGGERVQIDSAGTLVSGRKEFDFVVTARRAGATTIPPIEYPYFDPYAETYDIARSDSLRLEVTPGELVGAQRPHADSLPLLPIRRVYRGDLPKPISSSLWYWIVIGIVPVSALVLAEARRPRRRRSVTAADRLRALAMRSAPDPYDLRRTFAVALADRVPLASSQLTSHARLARALCRAGVSPSVAADAGALFAELDAAVFGGAAAVAPDAAVRADRIVRAVDAEALPGRELATWARSAGVVGALVLSLGAAAVHAASDVGDGAAADFVRGVEAYESRELDRAQALFIGVARAHPRAADAWANAGSVAWQRSDTAGAVVAWQRALRLEPLAADVRQNLEDTPGFDDGPLGDVAPAPLALFAWLGGGLWVAGWVLFALAGQRVVRRRTSAAAIVAAVVVAVAGAAQWDALLGRRAAVVVDADRLRAEPALSGEAGAEVVTGEIATTTGAEGAWTRVRLRDQRAGWIETRRLARLDQ